MFTFAAPFFVESFSDGIVFLVLAEDFLLSLADDTLPLIGGRGDLKLFLSVLGFFVPYDFPPCASFFLVVAERTSAALLDDGFSIAAAEELPVLLSLFMNSNSESVQIFCLPLIVLAYCLRFFCYWLSGC